jgi:hypothetical protein
VIKCQLLPLLVGVALSIISNFQWWVPILKVNFGPTTGNSAFAESPGLCREPSKKLSAKKALPRAPKKISTKKKHSAKRPLCRELKKLSEKGKHSTMRKDLAKRPLCREHYFGSRQRIFLTITFFAPNFLYSQYTHIQNLC